MSLTASPYMPEQAELLWVGLVFIVWPLVSFLSFGRWCPFCRLAVGDVFCRLAVGVLFVVWPLVSFLSCRCWWSLCRSPHQNTGKQWDDLRAVIRHRRWALTSMSVRDCRHSSRWAFSFDCPAIWLLARAGAFLFGSRLTGLCCVSVVFGYLCFSLPLSSLSCALGATKWSTFRHYNSSHSGNHYPLTTIPLVTITSLGDLRERHALLCFSCPQKNIVWKVFGLFDLFGLFGLYISTSTSASTSTSTSTRILVLVLVPVLQHPRTSTDSRFFSTLQSADKYLKKVATTLAAQWVLHITKQMQCPPMLG